MAQIINPEKHMKLTHEFFDELKKLNIPGGSYAVFGSRSMFAHGLRPFEDMHDIDVIVNQAGWEFVRKLGNPVPASSGFGDTVALNNGVIEFFNAWGPNPDNWNIQELIDEAEIIDGIPFVRLSEVVRWKKLMGREKDRPHLEMIYAKYPELRS